MGGAGGGVGGGGIQGQVNKNSHLVGHTPQSAQSLDQRHQLNYQNGSSYGGASSINYGTRSVVNQQVRNAFSSSQQKQVTRSSNQECSIPNIDSSSQSSISTHTKPWNTKSTGTASQHHKASTGCSKPSQNPSSTKLDGQNSGKCINCRYRVSKQERILYDCIECGNYLVSYFDGDKERVWRTRLR